MAVDERPSPKGKRVSLFVTCMVDMIYPETGMSVANILEHLGIGVDFLMGQTCCGQPGFNAGYRREAKTVAKQFLKVFKDAEVIVMPSGSCAAMVRHEYPTLFEGDQEWAAAAERAASITWELSEFIVEGLGISDLKAKLPTPQQFAIHDACHGLRILGLGQGARTLLDNTENAELVELTDCDKCCGFGGMFSVKMPDVSNAMLQKKITHIHACPAETIVTGDVSCMTQMNGGLSRGKSEKRVRHWADVLAEGLQGAAKDGSQGE
jgi:L-lactate dehydrogenase complex protein LldE